MYTIIWDFNGTILDDLSLCIQTENTLLAKRNLPLLTEEKYLEIFDFPIMDYYLRAGLDFEKEPFSKLAAEFIDIYQPASYNAPLRKDTVEVIQELKARGHRQVLLSASNAVLLKKQTDKFGITELFDEILGLGDIYAGSKVEIALTWMEKNQIIPQNVLLIGDTTHDFAVAQKIGCNCILLTGGHNSKKRLQATGAPVLDSARDIAFP